MPHCKIHNVRFYKPEPLAVRGMALQTSGKKLAVSRSNGTIEIWNLNNIWFIERTIAPTVDNFSVEGIAWSKNRLFSVGLHGLLIEYDLYKLTVKSRAAVTGESAFCLDINKNKIAVGTEQGTKSTSKKFLDKQEGRIICLKFDTTGEFVVTGSIDAIRVWSVESGHAIHKMTLGRSESNKPTIVWCLEVANDFTVITGDSRGKLTVWDGKVGSQLESYQSHKADILALCLSDDHKSLYCAGVDPNIINYVKISVKEGSEKWVKSIQRKIHEHDVNALVVCDNKLYSGGMDGYLACSFHPPKTLLKVPPILQNPCVQLAAEARCLMLRYSKYVEVWSLGRSENVEASFRGMLSLRDEPKKLLALQRVSKDYSGDEEQEGVNCSCMSDDGKWIMFSTCKGIRLFRFVYVDEKPNLLRVDDLENKHIPCVQAVFTPNSSQLILAPNNGGLVIYDLKDDRASVNKILEITDIKDTITFLTTSSCGKYLIIEYDIKKRQYTEFSRHLEAHLPEQWKSRSYPIRNITFDPRVDHIIIFQDDSNIIVINKEKHIK
ncbi:hypothetical protein NQ318_020813 [Aromia moschata]|uniref:Cirhin n=1 Tax=Aromia moschata TaxID=1265417 RepID=A0AAV8Y6Z0_9CUCU|nr:hypothetical protein NQ318_020813 [Aromia moschata]